MAFPNISDIATTTLELRSGDIADNVTKSNALLFMLSKTDGGIKKAPGGRIIYEEFAFAENGNGGWYSGYDTLPVSAQDVLSAAEFNWKQYAVPVTISGLEELQNDGKEGLIDLMQSRIKVAESTMTNAITSGLYSDGTGSGGKVITGLDAAVPQDPTTGTYGGINRATSTNTFWRSQLYDPGSTPTATTILGYMTTLWLKCIRGNERPNLIMSGEDTYAIFLSALQVNQRFTDPKLADAGFDNTKFMSCPVVPETSSTGSTNGVSGVDAQDMYFLNTKYLHFRPHSKRNMVPIGKRRVAVNQDAAVEILGWAGNLTCSAAKLQGRAKFD